MPGQRLSCSTPYLPSFFSKGQSQISWRESRPPSRRSERPSLDERPFSPPAIKTRKCWKHDVYRLIGGEREQARSTEVCLTVCPCVRLSVCPSVRMEHNGHARWKKHMVEQHCFVAHAQCNARTRTTNTREKTSGRKWTMRMSRAWTWQRTSKIEKTAARRAREGSERHARKLEGREDNSRALELESRKV